MIDLKILGIDTSGSTASVAVTENERVLGEITYVTKLTHSQIILPLVKELLDKTETELSQIDCIAVSEGPGSYTGLRIGISAVKGMCFAKDVMCYGASTLEALAKNVSAFEGVIAAVMHARPKISYFGLYRCKGGRLERISDEAVCGHGEISEKIGEISERVMLVGDNCEKIKSELFGDCDNVSVAPASLKLQRAAALCELAYENRDSWVSCDRLDARYLQITKAEKDLREKKQG